MVGDNMKTIYIVEKIDWEFTDLDTVWFSEDAANLRKEWLEQPEHNPHDLYIKVRSIPISDSEGHDEA